MSQKSKTATGKDIPAIDILLKEISRIKGIRDLPASYKAVKKYRQDFEEIINRTSNSTKEVNDYAQRINATMDTMKEVLKKTTARVQDDIKKTLNSILHTEHKTRSSSVFTGNTNSSRTVSREYTSLGSTELKENPKDHQVEMMGYVNELMQLEVSKERLEEAVVQTQRVFEKLQNDIKINKLDVDNLKECISSWEEAKSQSNEDTKLKETKIKNDAADAERRRREEEEQRRRMAKDRQKEEEEKRKRDKEERLRGKKDAADAERRRREEEEQRRRMAKNRQREEEEKKIREKEEMLKRKEEERKRAEERQEEEKRKRKEAEEKQRQEEEERRRQEQEEEEMRQRVLEAKERRKREEAERIETERRERAKEEKERKEEEERKRKEAEEKQRQEEERKRQKEEELRQRLLEAEERQKREEAERIETEKRERDRQMREEEERRRRLDPNNWTPLVYTRPNEEVDGRRSHHQGITCLATAVPDSLQEDDIECLASDEDRDLVPALADGERILSSVIEIDSKKGPLTFEAPIRVFIPHQPVLDAGDELVLKVSVNGSDWLMTNSVNVPTSSLTDKNVRLMGVELDNFNTAKVMVVARPRCENLIIDQSGTSQYSMHSKNVKLFVPRDAFKTPTEVKFSVKPVPNEILSTIETGSDFIGSILSTGPVVNLACHVPPAKDVEIDLLKSSNSVPNSNSKRGKSYQLFRTNKAAWQVADVEFKGRSKDLSISLPASKTHYSVMELEVPADTSKEEVARLTAGLYDCMNKSVVHMIVKQQEQKPEHVMVQCLRREHVNERLKELKSLGYTAGPDTSREFYLADGQNLEVYCSGNIESAAEDKTMVMMPFYAYMDTAKQEIMIQVKDKYKQRDLSEYVGNIHCKVLPLSCNTSNVSDVPHALDIMLPLTLPKREHIPLVLKAAPVRFPHYLSALTQFLSWKLAGSGHVNYTGDWVAVLSELIGKSKMQTLRNRAKKKCTDSNDQSLCRLMLEDWMKTTNVLEDKLGPIINVLNRFGLHSFGKECKNLVEYHKVKLSDGALQEIGDKVSEKPREIGERLELPDEAIVKCISDYPSNEALQVISLLTAWRHSQHAIEKGTNALEFLVSLV